MYNKIYDFCKVKNLGNCYRNGPNPTPRVNFITNLCKEMGIDYELDVWEDPGYFKSKKIVDFTIEDTPDILDQIDPANEEDVMELYYIFNEYGREMALGIGIDAYPVELKDEEKKALGIEYKDLVIDYTNQLNKFINKKEPIKNNFFNIVIPGNSDLFVVAHHDIVNPASDNANDNSCSVINCLMIKKLRPEVNVVILDGEESGGIGSGRLSKRINSGDFKCKWILNLELTGKGGKNFFVGAMGTPLTDWIQERFECPIVNVPFNDSLIFKRFGINSTVINPLPVTEEKSPVINKDGEYLDFKMLFNCHKMTDSVDSIDPKDMEEFVNEVCLKIIDEA